MSEAPQAVVLEGSFGRLLIELPIVGRVEAIDQVVPVPRSAEGITGLAEVRGRPVTLLDPQIWFDEGSAAEPLTSRGRDATHAFTFAAPFEHLGILVDRGTTLRSAGPRESAPRLDALSLTRRLDRLRASGGSSR